MSIIGNWTGQEAASLRTALRMPITEFAAYLGIAEGTVSKWERKLEDVEPTPWMQQVLDTALERASAAAQDRFLLLAVPRRQQLPGPPDEDTMADLNRRELLRLLSIAAPAIAVAGALEVPAADLPGDYGAATARLWRVYAQAAPKSAVLPLVNDQLRIVTARLRQGGRGRGRLCALASELFQLAGEIFFDGNRYTDAAHCYAMAATAADEAGSADLRACAMTRHSFIYVYGRDFPSAVPLLELAGDSAAKGDRQLSTRQWVSAVRAQALAGLGDLPGCQRALEEAGEVRGLPATAYNGGWLRFDGSRLAEESGTCYAELERPDLAAGVLERALVERLSPRRRGSVQTDLARTALQRRDSGEFAAHAGSALELAASTQSGYVARRLRALEPLAAPLSGSREVRDVLERIAALKTGQAA